MTTTPAPPKDTKPSAGEELKKVRQVGEAMLGYSRFFEQMQKDINATQHNTRSLNSSLFIIAGLLVVLIVLQLMSCGTVLLSVPPSTGILG